MRAIVFFAQLLLWLLIVRIVVRGLVRMFGGSTPSSRVPRAPRSSRAIEDLVLDRTCNTYLPRSRALVARVAGQEQPFCSKECRDKALAAVARAS